MARVQFSGVRSSEALPLDWQGHIHLEVHKPRISKPTNQLKKVWRDSNVKAECRRCIEGPGRALRSHTSHHGGTEPYRSRCQMSGLDRQVYDRPLHIIVHEDGSVWPEDVARFQDRYPTARSFPRRMRTRSSISPWPDTRHAANCATTLLWSEDLRYPDSGGRPGVFVHRLRHYFCSACLRAVPYA